FKIRTQINEWRLTKQGFSPYKVRVVFFGKPRKISTLSPLHSEIRRVLDCRQADIPKTGISGNRLALTIVPPETPELPSVK
ncbi:hypothetical protein, partial [Bacillus inaquosorum]|uniref:hypothetical protein n=1 Tax=Bacillus inaquosorum TaxID=483913 RepID=UPI001C613B27